MRQRHQVMEWAGAVARHRIVAHAPDCEEPWHSRQIRELPEVAQLPEAPELAALRARDRRQLSRAFERAMQEELHWRRERALGSLRELSLSKALLEKVAYDRAGIGTRVQLGFDGGVELQLEGARPEAVALLAWWVATCGDVVAGHCSRPGRAFMLGFSSSQGSLLVVAEEVIPQPGLPAGNAVVPSDPGGGGHASERVGGHGRLAGSVLSWLTSPMRALRTS